MEIILRDGTARAFERFDREAQFRDGTSRTMAELLDEFAQRRAESVGKLRALGLDEGKLAAKGRHPDLGEVTARQLLATWTAHDLAHILQISRVMAKRLKLEVGPWAEYLSVMR